jgi:hypothetical protein
MAEGVKIQSASEGQYWLGIDSSSVCAELHHSLGAGVVDHQVIVGE